MISLRSCLTRRRPGKYDRTLRKTAVLGITLLFSLGFSRFCVAAADSLTLTGAFNSSTNATSTMSKGATVKLKTYSSADVDTSRVPEDLRPFEVPLRQGHLLGDWATARTYLEDHGITPSVTFETDMAGNVSGGRSTGFAEADNLGINLVIFFQSSRFMAARHFI
jgi:hypothetical protein